ncbi:MAG: hypothetical protein ACE5GF_10100, partial [Thermodesulfobacteriota bacterium]
RFYRYGVDLNLHYGDFNILGALVTGNHDNPNGNDVEKDIISYLVEGDLLFYPWLTGIVRYELADVDNEGKRDSVTMALVALIRANLKLTVEGDIHTVGGGNDRGFLILEFAI